MRQLARLDRRPSAVHLEVMGRFVTLMPVLLAFGCGNASSQSDPAEGDDAGSMDARPVDPLAFNDSAQCR